VTGRRCSRIELISRTRLHNRTFCCIRDIRALAVAGSGNSLEVAESTALRRLLHGAEDEEKVPDVDPDLHAVGVGFAIVGVERVLQSVGLSDSYQESVPLEREAGKELRKAGERRSEGSLGPHSPARRHTAMRPG